MTLHSTRCDSGVFPIRNGFWSTRISVLRSLALTSCTACDLSQKSAIMTDIKREDSRSPSSEPVHKEDKIVGETAAENHYYSVFASKDQEWRGAFEKKLMRKVDLRLVPLLIIMYLNNFIDRAALGQARLGTLEADLNMSGTDFNLAISILFVGYLTMQLPSNLLITRIRPSLYLGITMMVWGAVCASTAAVQNLGGLIAVRIMLGVTEVCSVSSWLCVRCVGLTNRTGSILSWCHFPHVELVHSTRTDQEDCLVLRWRGFGQHVWRVDRGRCFGKHGRCAGHCGLEMVSLPRPEFLPQIHVI